MGRPTSAGTATYCLQQGSRIGEFVVSMDEHFQIGINRLAPKAQPRWDSTLPSMHALFAASGLGFPAGKVIRRSRSRHLSWITGTVASSAPRKSTARKKRLAKLMIALAFSRQFHRGLGAALKHSFRSPTDLKALRSRDRPRRRRPTPGRQASPRAAPGPQRPLMPSPMSSRIGRRRRPSAQPCCR